MYSKLMNILPTVNLRIWKTRFMGSEVLKGILNSFFLVKLKEHRMRSNKSLARTKQNTLNGHIS